MIWNLSESWGSVLSMQTTEPRAPANDRVATNLRILLATRQERPADLAAALDISPQSAGRRLRGEHDYRLTELEELARLFSVTLEDLLADPPTR